MVIIIGNRTGDPNSNPRQGCLDFPFVQMPLRKVGIHLFFL